MKVNPFIKPRNNSARIIMLDVLIALLPLVIIAILAYGQSALIVMGTAIVAAFLTEFIFSAIFLKKYNTVLDGSGLITALLLSFTLSPLTPWYVVAFGSSMAVLFGKIAWGGLGKNKFNPALTGREFMAVFFAGAMTNGTLWQTAHIVNIPQGNLFPGISSDYLSGYLNGMIYKTTGALGEYSILAILLAGLYLILRKRISWHIPLSLLPLFSLCFWLVNDGDDYKYSIAGVLLGALFMATDMPSSPNSNSGKLYYGAMIGLCAFMFIAGDVRHEYLSYAILLLNGFASKINEVFLPRVWGTKPDWKKRVEQVFLLTFSILSMAFAIISLYYYGWVQYLVYAYIIYTIFKFNFSFNRKINHPI